MPVGREYWRARALTAEPWRNAENSRVRAPSFFRVQPTNANGVVVSDTQDLHLHDVARDDETHQLVGPRPPLDTRSLSLASRCSRVSKFPLAPTRDLCSVE